VGFTLNGVSQTPATYGLSGFSPGHVLTVAQQAASSVTTGRYPWSATVTMNYATAIVRTVTGVDYAVAQDGSPFGSGWTYEGTDQLISIAADGNGPAGVLRAYGTGGERFYTSSGGGNFTSPAGDNGTLTQSGGTYTYQNPEGDTWTFNSSGYQTSWTSADGDLSWQYRYNGSNQLTGLTAPDGTLTTINYSGGLASRPKKVSLRQAKPGEGG
jgi:hypothetical protein